MCLGIPGKIIELNQSGGMRMCKVDFGGVARQACIETIPEAQVGDYILVHAGFALNVLSEEEAQETLKLLHEIAVFEEELGTDSNHNHHATSRPGA